MSAQQPCRTRRTVMSAGREIRWRYFRSRKIPLWRPKISFECTKPHPIAARVFGEWKNKQTKIYVHSVVVSRRRPSLLGPAVELFRRTHGYVSGYCAPCCVLPDTVPGADCAPRPVCYRCSVAENSRARDRGADGPPPAARDDAHRRATGFFRERAQPTAPRETCTRRLPIKGGPLRRHLIAFRRLPSSAGPVERKNTVRGGHLNDKSRR